MAYRIISGNKREYRLLSPTNSIISAVARKTFFTNANGLYVGDLVEIDDEGCICKLIERKNLLMRPKIANLDFMCIVTSLKEPDFASYLLEKFLTYLDYLNIKSWIIFSKADLLTSEELDRMNKYKEYYESLGYPVYLTSKKKCETVARLKEDMKGHVVAFMGQTGAGKSSLINLIDDSFQRLVGEYSKSLGRGKHQTKEVILIPFNDGLVGDTPGFSSLELNLSKLDMALSFPGFSKFVGKCYYNNCLHISEKECAIKESLKTGEISQESYDNYLRLLAEAKEGNKSGR